MSDSQKKQNDGNEVGLGESKSELYLQEIGKTCKRQGLLVI